ncbi:hypothetical protein NSK_001203 [Nannochloropsis salina CCMP1776]|uniref:Methyltransferase type 11 domain-containing protein n=1 Tax=Nannochloropsis salina CCMP1776 TaxID=1027361 RepID=A0A4D9D966_9STRA|nr:hypothetical protein NSK_001203 [Nannochloropsis salina CCMP1776]|eukprot:TFJ87856.1 hypothetical protein NSK_001203 [Nannochloropsis salina CCMP1776]
MPSGDTATPLREGTSIVRSVINSLSGAMVYTDVGNVETNRRLWNRYAEEWHGNCERNGPYSGSARNPSSELPANKPNVWVQQMAANTAKTSKSTPYSLPALALIGQEWSSPEDLEEVVRDFILPYLTPESAVVEVGVGGGRVAALVLGKCLRLTCLDISERMLEAARTALAAHPATGATVLEFILVGNDSNPSLPSQRVEYPVSLHGRCDFVYCFDVLVHVDVHTLYHTLREIRRLLKPSGKAFLSTANILSPAGWRRFAAQDKYTVGGFYFVSPEIVHGMLAKVGFHVVKHSEIPEGFKELSDMHGLAKGNLYYGRDHLVVVEKAPPEQEMRCASAERGTC